MTTPPRARALIAMIHLPPLPGAPRYRGSVAQIVDSACAEAARYADAGIDALMLENMHDAPYLNGRADAETVAAACAACCAVRAAHPRARLGLQLLAAANREALAVALAAGFDFIRAEGFVFAHVADEGIIESCAGELLRHRARLAAQRIAIYADIKKKHSAHAITSDVDLAETAAAAAFFGADGVIVTGSATGRPADPADVDRARHGGLPVLVGSGLTPKNLAAFASADGFIVGSFFKEGGRWDRPIDPGRVGRFVDAFRALPAPVESAPS